MIDRVVRVVLRGEVSSLVGSMSVASRSVRDTVDEMTAGTKEAQKLERGMTTMGNSAGKAGLVAAGGLAAMSKAAVDWESDWAGVTKTVDGTVGQLAELEDGLRELARTMPAAHQEIAATAEAAGQLGVAREDVAEFTETMIQLGETTNLTAEQAATNIAQMANVLGTAPDEVDNLGASLVALGNDGASTEAQILEMAQRIAGAGAQIGLAESDILAIANAAASMGIEVEAGGSSISRVFTELAKATSQGGPELVEFARIAGMTGDEFTRAFEEDPARAFASFTSGLDQINKSGGDVFTTLDELGLADVRVSQALLGMAASGDLLSNSLDLGAEAWQKNTALTDEYGKRVDTTAAQARIAWNNIKDAGIESGESLLPVISETAEVVADLASAFGDLPDPVHDAVGGLLAVTAITGGALWFGTKVIRGITDTRAALADLGPTGVRTGRMLRTGLQVGAIIGSLEILDSTIDSLFHNDIDQSNLQRSLDALASGKLTGELKKTFGDDLEDIVTQLDTTTDDFYNTQRKLAKLPGIGGIIGDKPGDGQAGLDDMADNIKTLDEALASMVESGSAAQAAAIIEQLKEAGATNEDIAEGFTEYGLALDNAGTAAESATGPIDAYGNATAAAGEQAAGSASQIDDLVDSMRKQRDAALSAFDAETQYRQALKAARDQAKESNAGLRGDSDEVLANRDAISSLAAAWNNQSEAVKNNRARFKEARIAFIETATAMGVPIEQARRLAQRLLEIPKQRVIKTEFHDNGALSKIDRIREALKNIPTQWRTDYYVNQVNSINKPKVFASGGSITGPGTRTSDSILIRASDGEFMQPADAVDYYGVDFMEAVRRRQLPRYASGGSIGSVTSGGQMLSVVPGLRAVESVRNFTTAVNASTKSLEREKRKRDDLVDARDNLASSVRGNLRSDLFGGDEGSVWLSAADRQKAGVGDPMSILLGDIRRAQEMQKATKTLRAKGLNGNALAELLSNGSIEDVKAFAGMSAREIALYEARFNQRERLTADVGRAAGQAAYGQAIATQTAEIRRMRAQLARIEKQNQNAPERTGAAVGKAVNAAAPRRKPGS